MKNPVVSEDFLLDTAASQRLYHEYASDAPIIDYHNHLSAAEIAADAERISSPVHRPEEGKVNPVALRIALDAGFPLAELHSPTHTITGSGWRDGTAIITLDAGVVPADRDFELAWKPETGTAPVAGVFREIVDGKHDEVPEQAFYMVGGIEEVLEKAEAMAAA